MHKSNSTDRALTDSEMAGIAGAARGFFNEIIAKGMAIAQTRALVEELIPKGSIK